MREARARLERALAPLMPGPRETFEAEDPVGDVRAWGGETLLLRALQEVEYDPADSLDEVRASVEAFRAANPGVEISYDSLIKDHWIRVVWNRCYVPGFRSGRFHGTGPGPLEALDALANSPDAEWLSVPNFPELLELHQSQHPRTPPLLDDLTPDGVLATTDPPSLNPHARAIARLGPSLFARLWDNLEFGPEDLGARLSWWMDINWVTEGAAAGFGHHLEKPNRRAFGAEVWKRLELEEDLIGWPEEDRRIAVQNCVQHGRDDLDAVLPRPAGLRDDTWVDWILWVDRHQGGFDAFDVNHECRRRLLFLFREIVRWSAEYPLDGSIDAWGTRLAELVRPRPALVSELIHEADRNSALLALLLLAPATAGLGLALLARRAPFVPHTYDVSSRKGQAAQLAEEAWLDGSECGVWSLTRSGSQEAARELAALLDYVAGLAMPRYRPQQDEWLALRRFRHEHLVRIATSDNGGFLGPGWIATLADDVAVRCHHGARGARGIGERTASNAPALFRAGRRGVVGRRGARGRERCARRALGPSRARDRERESSQHDESVPHHLPILYSPRSRLAWRGAPARP